ncbi:hypothetical protein PUR23_00810 [Methylorubrum populi]|uniref:hypothetical protein n=1 Tax=Methylorubrum populi TaxID=223967 RepID=UPI0031F8E39F
MTALTYYNRTTYFGKCYDISQNDLIAITKIIEDQTGDHPACTIMLADNSSIMGTRVEDVVSDTVLNLSKIASIRLSTSPYRSSHIHSLTLTFDESRMWGAASLSISGHRDAVGTATTRMYQFMEGKKRWFLPLNYSNSTAVHAIYTVIAIIVASVILMLQLNTVIHMVPSAYSTLVSMGFVLSVVVYVFLLKDVRNFLFPSLALRIGRSGSSADRRDVVRNFLIVSVTIGLSLSIIGSFIYDKIK